MPQALFTQAAIQVVAFFAGVPAGAVATATTVYGTYVAATAAVLQFVTITAASMAANKLLAPKMPSFSDASLADRTQMVRSPIAARQIVYGQTRVSGVVVYMSTTGTKNEFLHLVIALAGHEVEEIGDVYFNDELALTGSGSAASGRFTGYAEIYKKLGGDSQTVETNLETATSGLTNGKWTSNHRLRGIAYIYVQLKWSDQVWTGGIPNVSAMVKGKKVYDPRTATTVYSANAALCLRDYLTSTTYGLGMGSSEIDDTAFTAAANICDEQVEVKPVTSPATYEDRYETNGVLYTSASPDENVGKLLSAMGGLLAYSGGKVVPYAAGYRIPTVTLTDTDFAGGISVQTKTSSRDRVNAVKGVFVSEKSEWQPTDFPPVTSTTFYTQDNSIRYWRDVVLPMTTSSSAAQRLARIELLRARQELTFTARFRLDAMQVRAGDTVMVTLSKFGWSAKVFEVLSWNFVADGSPPQLAIEMTLRETASSVYDWSVSDEVQVDTTPTTTLPDPFALDAPTNLALTADGTTQLIQADGTAIPRIKVAWSAPSEQFIQSGGDIVIEYKQGNSTTYLTWSRVDGDQTLDYISSDVRIGTSYDVRISGLSYFGISTSYLTASITVAKDTTAPATPSGVTITAGNGLALSLDWDDNTEPDFSEYGVYRNGTGVTPSSITVDKIAETRSSRFVDTQVVIGTTYYYWINAFDAVENVSGFSTRVSGVASAVTAGADPTPPSTPSAPTYSTETTYIASDGTAFARINILAPAMPSGAVALNLLFRMSGASEWMLVTSLASGGLTVSVEGLAPGITYEFAAQGVSAFGILSTISSTISRLAPKDTTAPATPTGLASTVGTGKAVSLDWNDNTEADLSEYGVYRNTTGVTPASHTTDKIAEVKASRFVDADVSLATTYYYWVNAYDTLENVSGFATRVSAVPTYIPGTSVDQTAPSTPNAPTFASETTYLSSDGTSLARITLTAPAMPTLGKILAIIYRRSGSSEWIVANHLDSGSVAVSVDDLTPSVTYDFAARAISNFDILSAVSSTLTRQAPSNTTAPGTPSVSYISGEYAEPRSAGSVPMYAIGISITMPSSTDVAYLEAKIVNSNDSTSTAPAWYSDGDKLLFSSAANPSQNYRTFFYQSLNGTAGWGFVRAISRSGTASSWVAVGSVNDYTSLQKRPIGTLSQYNNNDVAMSGVKTGSTSASSVRQINAIFSDSIVVTLTGGALTETFNVSLTNRGFGAKPDLGVAQCASDANIVAAYDFDAAGNSSTNAVIRVTTLDGANLPAGGQRFSVELTEYT